MKLVTVTKVLNNKTLYFLINANGSAMVRYDAVCVSSGRVGALAIGFFCLDPSHRLKVGISI